MPPSTAVSELQQKLFKRMGIDLPSQSQGHKNFNPRGSTKPLSRKLQRKAQRVQKKAQRYSSQPGLARPAQAQGGPFKAQKNFQESRHHPQKGGAPQDAIKRRKEDEQLSDEDGEEMDMELDDLDSNDEDEGDEDEDEDEDDDEDDDEDEDDEDDEEDADESGGDEDEAMDDDAPKKSSRHASLSKAVREKLAQDDAEIDELERKLGIKKGRSSLPKAFKDDGLEEILGNLEADVAESEDDEPLKRKRDYDDWLASKRRKANPPSLANQDDNAEDMSEDSRDEDDSNGLEMSGEEDDIGIDEPSFDGFSSDGEEADRPQVRKKENPYVAPTTGTTVVAKYVPPSLRRTSGPESEARIRLQKQVQGLVNRLTEANILSIVQSTEELYQNNARGDVTEMLTSTILAQMQKPESVPDQFFVLTGGFSAAIYKIIGSSFGSHLVRQVVKDFGDAYEISDKDKDSSAIRKEASNMIGFLTQLYLFEVVSCKIVFDYLEKLLMDLNELNVELLLRICRMAGRLLRRDDPHALKHVTSILNKAIAKVGYANISARTKFMIETINDLRNSKPKARGIDSSIVSEHVLRMRKRLGELKSQSRRLDGLAPMGVGLNDIEKADTQGKWWLVGASVPVKERGHDNQNAPKTKTSSDDHVDLTDNEDMDFVLPDYPKKARAQGFNTTAQVAIFTAIMSAMNYEHGHRQFVGLGLKKDDQLEIARVLVQCVGSETQYNEYYALVARQACTNNRVRFAFQDRLWRIFRGLGESMFGEEAEDEETADSERMKDERRMGHVACFYASLIADGALSLSLLKPLNLPEMNSWTSSFVEWLMISLLRSCKGKEPKENAKVDKVFGAAAELPSLAAGVHWFLRKKIRKTKLIPAEEVKKLARVREKAQAVVQGQAVAED